MSDQEIIDEHRLKILAEPAVWGHRIGAPATEAEVRAMAAELLKLRARLVAEPDSPDPGGLY